MMNWKKLDYLQVLLYLEQQGSSCLQALMQRSFTRIVQQLFYVPKTV